MRMATGSACCPRMGTSRSLRTTAIGCTSSTGVTAAAPGRVGPGSGRKPVLDDQQVWADDTGVFMESVADVARQHGALPLGLISADATIHRWTLDDLRKELRAERPVILQVLFRALPGREDSLY